MKGMPALGVTDAHGDAPDALTSFLADPSTVYPVTIDPTVSLSEYHDTWFQSGDAVNHSDDHKLQIGYNGTAVRRALMQFVVPWLGSNYDVTNATLNLYQTVGATCTPKQTNAWTVTGSWTASNTVWGNQPSVTSDDVGWGTFSHGYSSSCPNGYGSIDITSMVRAWSVTGALPNYGLSLRAPYENDTSTAKTVCSMNPDPAAPACNTPARQPVLSMTYNSIPAASAWTVDPGGTGLDGVTYATSTTPELMGAASNQDGTPVRIQFGLQHDSNYPNESDGLSYWGATVSNVAPGAWATVQVPPGKLIEGHHYVYSVEPIATNGSGGDDAGWYGTGTFAVDATAPPSPTITCPYGADQWRPRVSGGVTCTLSSSSDAVAYFWSLDNPNPTTWASASNPPVGTTTVTIDPAVGKHTLYALAIDRAHNQSRVVPYVMQVGPGGVITPVDQARTQSMVPLTAQSSASSAGGYSEVTYRYREGVDPSVAWTTVPTADVHAPSGSPTFSAWPQAGTATGANESYSELDWNLAATIHAAGGGDGPVQIEACFDNGDPANPTCSAPITVTLAVSSFAASAATQPLGPGVVSLDTGDYETGATDAAEAGMSIGRTATSLRMLTAANNTVNTTSPTGIFGPGWQATLPGAAVGEADELLTDKSSAGYLTLAGSDGTTDVYQATTGAGVSATYTGIGDANDGSTIKCTDISTSCMKWTLTDTDGTTTTWTNPNARPQWTVAQVVESGTAATNTTSFTRDATGRVTRILAPVPDGVTCGATGDVCNASTSDADLRAGTQALELTYAASTTSGLSATVWGDYAGLVSSISYIAADPTTGTMSTTPVASFAYDDTGHLRASWDPRISPALKTAYDYDSHGRLLHITPPGRAIWSMAYDDQGRIVSVSRPDPANGTATQAVVYDGVDPASTSTGLPHLTASSGNPSATWGQSVDLPVGGAAVFPASHTPGSTDSHGDYTPTASDWPYADLSYIDVNGRLVDHAAYGAGAWQVDSTRYDASGNVTWALGALNRARALHPDADTDPYVASQADSANRANLLATVSTYSADGVDLLTTTGPTRQAQLATGVTASIRTQTANTYCEGEPTGNPTCHLLTTTKVSAQPQDSTPTSPADTRTTHLGYAPVHTGDTSGWTLREPTTSTTTMDAHNGDTDLVTTTSYDAQGRITSTQLPGSSGSDAGTTVTTYYTATGTGTCGGKPAWAGLVCEVGPAAQPAGTTIPSSVTTYDRYLSPATVTQTSGGSTRTSTTTYDAGQRPITTSISASPAADAGTPVPAATTSYDPATGDPTSVTAGGSPIATSYNSVGEETSYTDADGVTTTSTYDIDGRLHTVDDTKGSTIYYYDGTDAAGNTEHRGLLTKIDTGMTSTDAGFAGSAFTGGYDAGGNLTTENYPNGLVATTHYDDTGDPRSLTYAKGSTAWLSYTSTSDPFGETIAQTAPSSSQQFSYDPDGRLTTATDNYQGTCTTRTYGFSGAAGKDSDRTSLATSAPAPVGSNGTCPAGADGTTVTDTFDTADRITSTGYAYDKFGRTLAVPAGGLANNGATGSGTLSVGYYANDIVASQAQGTATASFTLDPASRIRGMVDTTAGTETRRTLNHYGDDSDSPTWTATSTNAGSSWTWERSVVGIDGNLAALQESDTSAVPDLQLTNLHGDIAATAKDDSTAVAPDATSDITEYGVPRDPNTKPARYSWVGGKRRSSDDLADLILMGVRLYNPTTGRFLSVDPIPGGNANPYTYPENPIDGYDLTGQITRQMDDTNPPKTKKAKKTSSCSAGCHLSNGLHNAVHAGSTAIHKLGNAAKSAGKSIGHGVTGAAEGGGVGSLTGGFIGCAGGYLLGAYVSKNPAVAKDGCKVGSKFGIKWGKKGGVVIGGVKGILK